MVGDINLSWLIWWMVLWLFDAWGKKSDFSNKTSWSHGDKSGEIIEMLRIGRTIPSWTFQGPDILIDPGGWCLYSEKHGWFLLNDGESMWISWIDKEKHLAGSVRIPGTWYRTSILGSWNSHWHFLRKTSGELPSYPQFFSQRCHWGFSRSTLDGRSRWGT